MDRAAPAVVAGPAGPATDGVRAWVIAAGAAAANAVTFGTLFSFGVYLSPIADEFGTGIAAVAPLLSAAILFYYLAGAVAGWIGDRYGIRPVVVAGGVLLPSGLALASVADQLWQVYLAYGPLVGLGVGCCYAPLIGTVGRWFERRREAAMALLLTGVGTGTLVGPIVNRSLIDAWGWRAGFGAVAIVAVVVIGVVAAVTTDAPVADRGPGVPLATVVRSSPFRWLYGSAILVSPGFFAPFAFLSDYAVDDGATARTGAVLIGVIGATSVAARLALGAAGGRFQPATLYLTGYGLLVAALATWLVSGGALPILFAAASLHGVGWAAWVTGTPILLARWFGVERLGGIIGLFYTGLGVGGLIGPAVSGVVIDRVSYDLAIGLVVVSTASAFVLALRATGARRLPSPR